MGIQKQSGIIDLGLSTIPFVGGPASGMWTPAKGLSPVETSNALYPYAVAGSVAGPLGYLITRNPKRIAQIGAPALKNALTQLIKNRTLTMSGAGPNVGSALLKILLAAGAGSAAAVNMGRWDINKNMGKTSFEQGLDKEAFELKDVANTAGKVVKSIPGVLYDWIINPGVQAVKDVGSSANMLWHGDVAGGATRAMSALGNGILFGSNLIPWVGPEIGAALGAGAKGIGLAAKALGAANAGSKMTRAGTMIARYGKYPMMWARNLPFGLGSLVGANNIFKAGPAKTLGGKVLNQIKLVGNTIPTQLASGGLAIGSNVLYDKTRGGKLEQMMNSGALSNYLGKDLVNQISGLSRGDQLKVYDKLESLGVPGQILGDWAQPGPKPSQGFNGVISKSPYPKAPSVTPRGHNSGLSFRG